MVGLCLYACAPVICTLCRFTPSLTPCLLVSQDPRTNNPTYQIFYPSNETLSVPLVLTILMESNPVNTYPFAIVLPTGSTLIIAGMLRFRDFCQKAVLLTDLPRHGHVHRSSARTVCLCNSLSSGRLRAGLCQPVQACAVAIIVVHIWCSLAPPTGTATMNILDLAYPRCIAQCVRLVQGPRCRRCSWAMMRQLKMRQWVICQSCRFP